MYIHVRENAILRLIFCISKVVQTIIKRSLLFDDAAYSNLTFVASLDDKKKFLNSLHGKSVLLFFSRTQVFSGRLMSFDDDLNYIELSMVINLETKSTSGRERFSTTNLMYVREDPMMGTDRN
ncbi:hypothetical protein NPIL_231161 [Nephila pilipes]|uniref:LSM domain-containing protein n=1 Tax=Nephila pilipes TaxID=299642 RepID=A0A8X6QZ14_NEPPI|nr:hypothetical protein NPIL_231161 [Nephila pilipes]